jgi:hypothetical protein
VRKKAKQGWEQGVLGWNARAQDTDTLPEESAAPMPEHSDEGDKPPDLAFPLTW